jgi:hypothetical protein
LQTDNQCLGRNKNLSRCQRKGSWSLFCGDHTYQWITAIVFLIGTLYGAVSVISKDVFAFSTSKNQEAFFGSWQTNYSYQSNHNVVAIDGVVDYFENGKYNFTGHYRITSERTRMGVLEILYDVKSSGTWQYSSNFLTISQEDIKSSVKDFKIDGLHNQFYLDAIGHNDDLSLNNYFPKGFNDKYKLLKVDSHMIRMEGRSPDNEKFTIDLDKRDTR